MKDLKKGILIGIIIGLIIGVVGGYFIYTDLIHGGTSRNFPGGRGNFQISDASKAEVTSFFENTTDINSINSYCQQNRMNCAYYCRTINPSNEACSSIMNFTRMGGIPQ